MNLFKKINSILFFVFFCFGMETAQPLGTGSKALLFGGISGVGFVAWWILGGKEEATKEEIKKIEVLIKEELRADELENVKLKILDLESRSKWFCWGKRGALLAAVLSGVLGAKEAIGYFSKRSQNNKDDEEKDVRQPKNDTKNKSNSSTSKKLLEPNESSSRQDFVGSNPKEKEQGKPSGIKPVESKVDESKTTKKEKVNKKVPKNDFGTNKRDLQLKLLNLKGEKLSFKTSLCLKGAKYPFEKNKNDPDFDKYSYPESCSIYDKDKRLKKDYFLIDFIKKDKTENKKYFSVLLCSEDYREFLNQNEDYKDVEIEDGDIKWLALD